MGLVLMMIDEGSQPGHTRQGDKVTRWQGDQRGKQAIGTFCLQAIHELILSPDPRALEKCKNLGQLLWLSWIAVWLYCRTPLLSVDCSARRWRYAIFNYLLYIVFRPSSFAVSLKKIEIWNPFTSRCIQSQNSTRNWWVSLHLALRNLIGPSVTGFQHPVAHTRARTSLRCSARTHQFTGPRRGHQVWVTRSS